MSIVVTPEQLKAALQSTAQPATDPSMQQLGDKFKSLMQNPRMEAHHDKRDDMNVVSKLAASQDAELQQSVNDALSLTQNASGMSMQQMTAAGTQVILEIAGTQLDMQAKMGVMNSSRSSLDTLMKNQ
jgi:type III secretion inner rod protein HrpB2